MSVLGVYANAEKIILAHATSKTRSLRAEVIAAIDAKDAAVAAGGENGRPKVAQRITKVNPTAMKCPELCERIVNDDGGCADFRCKKCKVVVFYKNWGRHCN